MADSTSPLRRLGWPWGNKGHGFFIASWLIVCVFALIYLPPSLPPWAPLILAGIADLYMILVSIAAAWWGKDAKDKCIGIPERHIGELVALILFLSLVCIFANIDLRLLHTPALDATRDNIGMSLYDTATRMPTFTYQEAHPSDRVGRSAVVVETGSSLLFLMLILPLVVGRLAAFDASPPRVVTIRKRKDKIEVQELQQKPKEALGQIDAEFELTVSKNLELRALSAGSAPKAPATIHFEVRVDKLVLSGGTDKSESHLLIDINHDLIVTEEGFRFTKRT